MSARLDGRKDGAYKPVGCEPGHWPRLSTRSFLGLVNVEPNIVHGKVEWGGKEWEVSEKKLGVEDISGW